MFEKVNNIQEMIFRFVIATDYQQSWKKMEQSFRNKTIWYVMSGRALDPTSVQLSKFHFSLNAQPKLK